MLLGPYPNTVPNFLFPMMQLQQQPQQPMASYRPAPFIQPKEEGQLLLSWAAQQTGNVMANILNRNNSTPSWEALLNGLL